MPVIPPTCRKSFDGLQALVRQHLGDDPLLGRNIPSFINRRRTLCKVLCFEAGGFHALVDALEIRVMGRRRRWIGGNLNHRLVSVRGAQRQGRPKVTGYAVSGSMLAAICV